MCTLASQQRLLVLHTEQGIVFNELSLDDSLKVLAYIASLKDNKATVPPVQVIEPVQVASVNMPVDMHEACFGASNPQVQQAQQTVAPASNIGLHPLCAVHVGGNKIPEALLVYCRANNVGTKGLHFSKDGAKLQATLIERFAKVGKQFNPTVLAQPAANSIAPVALNPLQPIGVAPVAAQTPATAPEVTSEYRQEKLGPMAAKAAKAQAWLAQAQFAVTNFKHPSSRVSKEFSDFLTTIAAQLNELQQLQYQVQKEQSKERLILQWRSFNSRYEAFASAFNERAVGQRLKELDVQINSRIPSAGGVAPANGFSAIPQQTPMQQEVIVAQSMVLPSQPPMPNLKPKTQEELYAEWRAIGVQRLIEARAIDPDCKALPSGYNVNKADGRLLIHAKNGNNIAQWQYWQPGMQTAIN